MVPGVPKVPKGGCQGAGAKGAGAKGAGALIVLALSLSCQQSPRVSDCQWRQSADQPRALLDDIRLAEDIAVRFADAQGYRTGWRSTREACEATLFAGLAAARGMTVEDISAARTRLDQRGFDWLVNVPIAILYVLVVWSVTRRIRSRFAGELVPTVIAILLASLGLAIALVGLGQLWAGAVEVLRIGNGHLSYRASRIPWTHHRESTFVLAVFAVWFLGFVPGSRRTSGTNPLAP